MRVTIVTTRHGAQDDRIYHKEAVSLAKRLGVTMIAPDDGDELVWAPGVSFRPIPRRRGPLGRIRAVLEATREVVRERPDFCHLHDLDLVLAIPLIRALTRARIIYDSHEVFTRDDMLLNRRMPEPWLSIVAAATEAAERALLSAGHHVVTAVEPGDRAFQGIRVPLTTVFNYPPLHLFEGGAGPVDEVTARSTDRLPIVYHGVMSRERGLFHMLEAVALLRQTEPRVLLRLIGLQGDRLTQEVNETIGRLGISEQVEIAGWLPHEEVAARLRASLIGLVPLQPCEKYRRALPVKLLEYMACGLPVIAARLTLLERYVQESGGGLLYDSARADELAQCVLTLLRDPTGRRRMGDNGARAVRERWNWGRMEDVLFGVYESLGARFEEATG